MNSNVQNIPCHLLQYLVKCRQNKMSEISFYTAVDAIYQNWTALQLIVSNGAAGPKSKDIAKWMVSATVQWFSENKDLEFYEVEDFLIDIVWQEFHVHIQDGSETEISKLICEFYNLSTARDGEAEFKRRLQALPKCDLSKCRTVDQADDNIDDVADQLNKNLDLEKTEPEQKDPDGWEVVKPRKNKASKSQAEQGPSEKHVECPDVDKLEKPEAEEKDPDGWEVVKPRKNKKIATSRDGEAEFKHSLQELPKCDSSKCQADQVPSEEHIECSNDDNLDDVADKLDTSQVLEKTEPKEKDPDGSCEATKE